MSTPLTDILRGELKNRSLVLRGTYRGILFEVCKFASVMPEDFEYGWNSYLFLNLSHFSDESFKHSLNLQAKDRYYSYMRHPFLSSIDFHGGITYYAKRLVPRRDSGEDLVLKLGCDYMHYGDQGRCYSWENVTTDIKNAIDSVHNMTDYKIMCQRCGVITDKAEGHYPVEDKSVFRCNACDKQVVNNSLTTGA